MCLLCDTNERFVTCVTYFYRLRVFTVLAKNPAINHPWNCGSPELPREINSFCTGQMEISKSRKHSSSIPQFSLESHRMDYKSHDVN